MRKGRGVGALRARKQIAVMDTDPSLVGVQGTLSSTETATRVCGRSPKTRRFGSITLIASTETLRMRQGRHLSSLASPWRRFWRRVEGVGDEGRTEAALLASMAAVILPIIVMIAGKLFL